MSKPKTMNKDKLLRIFEMAFSELISRRGDYRYKDFYKQAYNQIKEVIEQHFGGKNANKG